jgi:hypothetical protein
LARAVEPALAAGDHLQVGIRELLSYRQARWISDNDPSCTCTEICSDLTSSFHLSRICRAGLVSPAAAAGDHLQVGLRQLLLACRQDEVDLRKRFLVHLHQDLPGIFTASSDASAALGFAFSSARKARHNEKLDT